jgi:hypothetical protein
MNNWEALKAMSTIEFSLEFCIEWCFLNDFGQKLQKSAVGGFLAIFLESIFIISHPIHFSLRTQSISFESAEFSAFLEPLSIEM